MPKKASSKTPAKKTTPRRTTKERTAKKKATAKGKGGAKRGVKKTSADEVEQRCEFTAEMIAKKLFPHQIKRILKETYGVSRTTAERYMGRARIILAENWEDKTTEEHQRESIMFYNAIIADEKTSIREKIRAQSRLDVVAVKVVKRVAITDADGRTLTRDAIESKISDLAASVLGNGATGESS